MEHKWEWGPANVGWLRRCVNCNKIAPTWLKGMEETTGWPDYSPIPTKCENEENGKERKETKE